MKKFYINLFFAVMLLFTITVSVHAQNIIYIGGGSNADEYASDRDIIDSLDSWGIGAEYWDDDVFKTSEIIWSNYDGAFINETVGSGGILRFGTTDGYPVPCICLEGWAPNPDRWAWVSSASEYKENGAGTADELIAIVSDNQHYITQNYKIGDEILWSANTSADISSIKLRSIKEVNIPFTAKLGKDKALSNEADFWGMIAIDDQSVMPNRMLWWGLNNYGLNGSSKNEHFGTNAFFDIIKRGCEWAYLGEDYLSAEKYTVQNEKQLKVYPNPAAGLLNINFNSDVTTNTKVTLFNASGKKLEVLFNGQALEGNNFISVNVKKYSKGLYFIELMEGSKKEHIKVILK
jgi:hypothetical protein